jgi:hypothetical protein
MIGGGEREQSFASLNVPPGIMIAIRVSSFENETLLIAENII